MSIHLRVMNRAFSINAQTDVQTLSHHHWCEGLDALNQPNWLKNPIFYSFRLYLAVVFCFFIPNLRNSEKQVGSVERVSIIFQLKPDALGIKTKPNIFPTISSCLPSILLHKVLQVSTAWISFKG